MASSNRHWPSMFKSKPQHQWQHDNNSPLLPSSCHRSSSPYPPGCEERTPEPKPRWNPKPEQIRILEAIFNSGMVNPPRDEIRKIRAQLQEYGQVGDANVFYWFQNRKSRSKHKLRLLHGSKHSSTASAANAAASSSSSSNSSSPSPKGQSSKSSHKNKKNNTNNNNLSLNSPISGEVNPTVGGFPAGQTEFNGCDEIQIPGFLPSSATHSVIASQLGFGFGNDQLISNMVQKDHQQPTPVTLGPCTSLLLSEIMNVNSYDSSLNQNNPKETYESRANLKMLDLDPQLGINYPTGFSTSIHCNNNIVAGTSSTSVTVPSSISQLQGVGEEARPERLTVFINEVAFDVASGPFNVRQAFGEDAVLISSSGQPIVTNEWGVTLNSLHHGALYYLI